MSHPDRLLTLRQAATLIRRHPDTVRRWLRAGELPGARRVRDGWLIPASALAAMVRLVQEPPR